MMAGQFPFPFTTEGADAQVEIVDGGRNVRLSFTVSKDSIDTVIERWTWNEASVTLRSRDRDIVIFFPPIKEQQKR